MIKLQFEFIKSIAELVIPFGFTSEVANYIGCQFALESKYGMSKLARENFNFCGMKTPLVRISCACNLGSKDTFAKYHSLADCVTDFMLRHQYFKPLSYIRKQLGDYKYFLKDSCYCPEKDYIKRIDVIYQQFLNY